MMLRYFAGFFAWVLTAVLQACPCGCGSVFPLSLYPGETWKYRIGLSRQFFQDYVHADGTVGQDISSPATTDTVQLSVARALRENLSVFMSLPIERNSHPDARSHGGISDPSIGVRWTLNPYQAAQVYRPQVALHMAYKQKIANSLDDASEAEVPYLGVHSNGWNEIIPGVDLLFHWNAWSLSGSQAFILRPMKVKLAGEDTVSYRSGLGNRSILSAAYTFYGYGQLSGGLEREYFARSSQDGRKLPDSQVKRYAAFLTSQVRVGTRQTVEMGLRRSGFDEQNQNTPRYVMITVGYAHSL